MKSKLLIVELWGLGDLVIGTPFLRAAVEHYEVCLVAKPYAVELQERLWPGVRVMPVVAPWTAFTGKYRLWKWPWGELWRLIRQLRCEQFAFGVYARWDPRDHVLLALAGVRTRFGFPRLRSWMYLTQAVARPSPQSHRYEYWRALAHRLEFELPLREQIPTQFPNANGKVLLHTGAGQPVRVWPLERYLHTVRRLRERGHRVQVACDADQRVWWLGAGEADVATPHTVKELLRLIDDARVFIGNDSGPGHLAAFCGVPTFTLFGPQLSEWFAPLHPHSDWIDGKACPYKPCSDYCRFPTPVCMTGLGEEEVWARLQRFEETQARPVATTAR